MRRLKMAGNFRLLFGLVAGMAFGFFLQKARVASRDKTVNTFFRLGLVILSGVAIFHLACFRPAWAAEKLRFATPVEDSPLFYLPSLAGEEKGFWKEEGLEAVWFPFKSGGDTARAFAAKEVGIGLAGTNIVLTVASRGVPIIIVADLNMVHPFYLWVAGDSPIKGAGDLKGKKIGISRTGSFGHALGRAVVKDLGLEDQIKFVAVGGVRQLMAGLKAGVIDGLVLSLFTMAGLKFRGEVKEVLAVQDFLPRKWMDVVISAHGDFVKENPDAVKGMVRGTLRAASFVMKNQAWALEKMKKINGWPEDLGRQIFALLRYSPDGRIDKEGLENIRSFFIKYGIIPKEKAPAAEQLYTDRFTG